MWNRVSSGRSGGNTSNRPVCPFFLEGRCKFGDSCRNYHPPAQNNTAPATNQNRFGALSGAPQGRSQPLPYHLNVDAIKSDLTPGDDKPGWPLSCYGPGRDAPRQLIEGVLEQSPEELRVQYYLAKTSGSTQQYEENERAALQQAEQQARQILNDIDGAIKFVIDAKDQHPNREDVAQKNPANFNWVANSTSTANSSVRNSSFGRPSNLGGSSASGSVFGQPSAPGATSAFGQPSNLNAGTAFGRPSTAGSAFGQPSQMGGGGGAAFGQPSAMGSAFPKPSGLGTANSSAFGQASTLGNGTSPFASAANTGSAFGQQNSNSGQSVFGQPSSATVPATTTSPFGAQPVQQSAGTTGFGQQSNLGQQPTNATQSPFGVTNGSTSGTPAFGQPSKSSDQSSPFGASQAPSTNTAFGRPSVQANPFSSNSNNNINNKSSPFGVQSASQQGPHASAFGSASSFKGRAVEQLRINPKDPSDTTTAPFYTNAQGKKERIWHPDGPPGPNTDAEGPLEAYEGEIGNILKQIYDTAQQSDLGFKDGFIPEIPPKREWISFEL